MNFRLTGVAFATVLLVGCASAPDKDPQGRSDPLEGFNRTMFDFNYNVLDPYILRPVAVAWRDYVPMPARNGISNFTSNLEEPASMVNAFLKGDPYRGMIHFNRFFLNTLLGMGGLIDVAGMANPKLAREEPNRFGSTLGHYDVGYGPYVMLPGYGSFTLRDEGGDFADTLYPMLSYLTFWMSAGKWVVGDRNPRPAAGFRWSAAQLFRSLHHGARSLLSAPRFHRQRRLAQAGREPERQGDSGRAGRHRLAVITGVTPMKTRRQAVLCRRQATGKKVHRALA